ncbi:MAG: NTP transferase domain-containing protein [Thermoleophilia bacterium]|nr:NTP transferase domain-containing protein [Thermoleophilia bacterium]MDQ3856997.1 NTP transferase domain-containing protein [Actinomycetota bacterium]
MARDGVTGALLVGGASRRFGSPKALARLDGETLAERAHRTLAEAFPRVVVVGKVGDGLPLALPLPLVDDGSDVRAPIVGVAAALRAALDDLVVVLPTDVPAATPELLVALAEAAAGVDAAVPQTGPLPGAYRRSALPVLERRIALGDLALRDALGELRTRVVAVDPALVRNVNTPDDLSL